MEQEYHDQIDTLLRLAERKPKLIEGLLEEREVIQGKLLALGYEPPKKTRKPRAPKPEGSGAEPKRRGKIRLIQAAQ